MTAQPSNAFLGRSEPPSAAELASVLGASASLWEEFIDRVTKDEAITAQEWKGIYPNKYGWTLRLVHKKRNIVYLSPCQDCFRVAFVLNDKAMKAARESTFPGAVATAIATAPHYPEGTGVRLLVKRRGDLAPVLKLAHIKAAN